MGPTTGRHSFGDLRQLVRGAKAGEPGSVEMMLAACRHFFVAVGREELPDVPGREAELQALVEQALARVPAILAALGDASTDELLAELRREFHDQLRTLTAPPAFDLPTTDHSERRESRPDASLAGVQTEPAAETPSGDSGRAPPALLKLEGFENVAEVGGGGMGVVYRAWQARLKRWVALKCLPRGFAGDADRLRRFRQEALLAAGLTQPGIVQVHDVLEVDGTPVLVLPYIDGCDLHKILDQRRRLREGKQVFGPHAESQKGERDFTAGMLPFFDRILDALVGLHGAGVLHRDLKPSNILVDKGGNGWLTDFGLARLARSDAAPPQLRVMGTRGFMSPEQWDGSDATDARTDVFALGVTVYEALTLELPYGMDRITAATPPAKLPKRCRRFLPPDLDLVLLKAIHPDRQLRYQTAADFRDDWQRVRKGALPHKARVDAWRRLVHAAGRRVSQAVAVAAVAVAAAVLALFVFRQPAPLARNDAAQPAVPAPKQVRTVRVTTDPPGARVALVPLDPEDGTLQFGKALQPEGKTPVVVPGVPPGDYLLVAEVAGRGFHEVQRRVPEVGEASPTTADMNFPQTSFRERDGTVELPEVVVPGYEVTRGMEIFPGGKFTMGSADYGPAFAPPHDGTAEAFYLDPTEVTVAAFRDVRHALPGQLAALAPKGDEAVRFVNFYQAANYAELLGKRLPDEAEYEFAASNAGANRFPWGNDAGKITSWKFGPVGTPAYDRALAHPAVAGLYSNVAEWTTSWNVPYPGVERRPDALKRIRGERVVRGAPLAVVKGDPLPPNPEGILLGDSRFRQGVPRETALPGLGFRCARSLKPRFPQPAGD